jgi:hypothetical protein
MNKAEENNSTECLETHITTHTKARGRDDAIFRGKGRLGMFAKLNSMQRYEGLETLEFLDSCDPFDS